MKAVRGKKTYYVRKRRTTKILDILKEIMEPRKQQNIMLTEPKGRKKK